MTPSWLARVGARAQSLTNNTDGLVNMYMIDFQMGWNPTAYKPSTKSVAANEAMVEETAPVQPSRPVTISEANPAPILQDMSYAALAGGATEINFSSSRYALNKKDQEHLSKVAKTLEANKDLFESVEIQGYADATGNPTANQRLSQRRADSVAKVLKSSGLKDVEVVAVGKGASDTMGSKAQDRRAELIFKGVKDEDALRRALTEIE
jgi:outer membrane protein OmpA-like peptidoglycan-associated protein